MKHFRLSAMLAIGLAFVLSPSCAQEQSASIQQMGSNSEAAIVQSGSSGPGHPVDIATIIQRAGIGNAALIVQTANITSLIDGLSPSTASIDQAGNANVARITQERDIASGTVISQEGDGNRADVLMSDVGAHNHIAQAGNSNTAAMTVNGLHLDAGIDQDGFGNAASVDQTGSRNTIYASQSGSGNALSVTQTGGVGFIEAINFIDITQSGWLNVAAVEQAGLDLNAAVVQDGTANTARISQLGRDFIARIVQDGAGNTATITQHF